MTYKNAARRRCDFSGEAARDPPAFARHLLARAFRVLGRRRPKGFGLHTLRRKFATDLKGQPLKVVAKLGGWRDLRTLLRYQRVTEADERTALVARGERRPAPPRSEDPEDAQA